MEDVVSTSALRIDAAGVRTVEDVRRQPVPLIAYGDALLESSREMRGFLFENVYYRPEVAEVNERACNRLAEVFDVYLQTPARLGQSTTARIETQGLHRTVCDYLSGMTDRYLLEEHARLFGGELTPVPR